MTANKSSGLAAAALLLACACGGPERVQFRPAPSTAQAGLQPCPVQPVDTAGWHRRASRFLPFTVLLPAEVRLGGPIRGRDMVGEGWSDPAGRLSVTYAYVGPEAEPLVTGEAHVPGSWRCLMHAGGTVAEVESFTSRGVVPGEVVLATWRGAGPERLVVRLISPDPGSRDRMLAVLRSVEFGNDP